MSNEKKSWGLMVIFVVADAFISGLFMNLCGETVGLIVFILLLIAEIALQIYLKKADKNIAVDEKIERSVKEGVNAHWRELSASGIDRQASDGERGTSGEGSCGKNLTWKFKNDILMISGAGKMEDYIPGEKNSPWSCFRHRIRTVILQDGISRIGNYAFYGVDYLTEIKIPDSVTEIGEAAFQACFALQSISIPEAVKAIPAKMMMWDCGMEEIQLPASISEIHQNAFADCRNMLRITLPEELKSIASGVFNGCIKLKDIYFKGTIKQWNAMIGSDNHCQTKTTLHCRDQIEHDSEALAEKIRREGVIVRLIPAWSSNRKAGLVSALLNSDPAEIQDQIRKVSAYDLNIFLQELNDEIAAAAPEDREILKIVYDFADEVQKHE